MSMANDIYHKAARDGYVHLLQETTRRDCDRADEDGRSPTLWAASCGNLEALRVLTSRGGNPDKSDHVGSSALHLAAASGHMSCVSYLVSFGANIWAMDNDLHTSLDVASIHGREEIIRFLDTVTAKQTLMNRKLVKKMKEKALLQAQRRAQQYSKLQKKAEKQAMRDDKKLVKERTRMEMKPIYTNGGNTSLKIPKFRSDRSLSKQFNGSQKSSMSEPLPYSAHFKDHNNRKFMAGVAKKLKGRSAKGDTLTLKRNGDFKVRNLENDGTRTIKSLSGLRRDPHIMYVRGISADSDNSGQFTTNFDPSPLSGDDKISRAFSEPDLFFGSNGDSGVETDSNPHEVTSIFERPGFGNVAFINSRMTTGALLSLPDPTELQDGANMEGRGGSTKPSSSDVIIPVEPGEGRTKSGDGNKRPGAYDGDSTSIGSIGTLAIRMQKLARDEGDDDDVDSVLLDDDDVAQSSALELFLASNGLTELIPLFSREKVDLDALMLLTDIDFKELGLHLGPRRKLIAAVKLRQEAVRCSGPMTDSLV